jgi:hypothetical protein
MLVSSYLLAAQAKKPPLTATQLELMLSYEAGTAPTRSANPGSRPRGRLGGRYLRLPYQRAPNRPEAVMRRKRLALTNPVPIQIGCQLTESQRAYARLVRDEHERHGFFDLCHDEAAARIGTCPKTAKRAQAELKKLALISVERRPQPGRKNLPNIVKIIAPQWLMWIERGPKSRREPIGGHEGQATGAMLNKERLSQHPCRQPADAEPRQARGEESVSIERGLSRKKFASVVPSLSRRL